MKLALALLVTIQYILISGCSEKIFGSAVISEIKLKSTDLEINDHLLRQCNKKSTVLRILSEDNAPRHLTNNAFSSFSHLQTLLLKVNLEKFLAEMHWEKNLTHLNSLSLPGCGLYSLPLFGFLRGLPNLTLLNVSNNFLHFLPPDFLEYSTKLLVLDLSGNNFVEIPYIPNKNAIREVRLNKNPIQCNCQNQWLIRNQPIVHLESSPACQVKPCKYFVTFEKEFQNETLISTVAGSLTLDCCVNSTSGALGFGLKSPIGFIAGPSWENISISSNVHFSYNVAPILTNINVKFDRKNQFCASLSIDYLRGHHKGHWTCFARTPASAHISPSIITVLPVSHIDLAYENSLIFGFCVMAATLLTGIIIGSVRYLTETNCCRKSQLHKYIGRTLIGVIPVIGPKKGFSISFSNIALNDRICPACLLQTCFFCAHCQSVHAYTDIEVKSAPSIISVLNSIDEENFEPIVIPSSRLSTLHKRQRIELSCPAESCSLLEPITTQNKIDEHVGDLEDKARNADLCALENWPSEVRNELFASQNGDDDKIIRKETEVNCLYEFPTEFCHCCHQSHYYNNSEVDISEQSMRHVKLIVKNEKLAKEYIDALQVLKDAADANDAAIFRTRLEEFRGKLLQDIGAGVRVARNELASLRAISAKKVATIRDQSAAAAQKVKASLSYSVSQMRYGMRSVAELCGVAGPIGQSISVISVYKDENSDIPQERCISEFHF